MSCRLVISLSSLLRLADPGSNLASAFDPLFTLYVIVPSIRLVQWIKYSVPRIERLFYLGKRHALYTLNTPLHYSKNNRVTSPPLKSCRMVLSTSHRPSQSKQGARLWQKQGVHSKSWLQFISSHEVNEVATHSGGVDELARQEHVYLPPEY